MKPEGMKDTWFKLLEPLFQDERFELLKSFLKENKPFSPDFKKVFRAFSFSEVDDTKVVILGLSPYQSVINGEKIATGLAFGVKDETHDTPSLKCIRDALCLDTGIITVEDYFDWTLESWANQGVLLLNTALTVKTNGDARSHLTQWEWFMTGLFEILNDKFQAMPFVFLGKDAQKFSELIDDNYIIKAHHPAAASYGKGYDMYKQGVFKQIDEITYKINGFKINWLQEEY